MRGNGKIDGRWIVIIPPSQRACEKESNHNPLFSQWDRKSIIEKLRWNVYFQLRLIYVSVFKMRERMRILLLGLHRQGNSEYDPNNRHRT